MIWLAVSAYAILALLFVVGLCRAASRASVVGVQPKRSAPEHLVDLTEADEQAERGA